MAAKSMRMPWPARRRFAAGFALALLIGAPSYAESPYANTSKEPSRFEIRDSAVRSATTEPDVSRFVLSAKLQAPKPEVDPNARFTASAQIKATTASPRGNASFPYADGVLGGSGLTVDSIALAGMHLMR